MMIMAIFIALLGEKKDTNNNIRRLLIENHERDIA